MPNPQARHWWQPAATLAERAASTRARTDVMELADGESLTTPTDRHERNLDHSRVEAHVNRWRTQRPFDQPEFLARRLRVDALDEATFRTLAGRGNGPASANATAPAWVEAVVRANELARAAAQLQGERSDPDDSTGIGPARAFVEPFVAVAMQRLFASARVILAAYPDAPFDPEHATRLFESALWGRLLMRAMKVVILEVNVARVQGTLVGDTPESRCANFAAQLRTTDVRQRIMEEYPVLARSLVTAAEHWQRMAAEFLDHLAADADVLSGFVADASDAIAPRAELGVLTSLQAGAGDVHRHGRSVIVAEFSTGVRLVYKPRSLAVDQHFGELVAWVNARGQAPLLRAVRAVSCGNHGWAEFVPGAPCREPAEVSRFYERFGAQLALLHVLEATDFHYENVIASGEYPMLIDLEALFHPQPDLPNRPDEPEWLGWMALQRSVLRAGVLPFRADAGQESAGIDLSALGGGKGQKSPHRHPVLAAGGTDEMHLVRDYVQLPDSNNRPALGTGLVNPALYADRILAGFTSTYQLLMRHRSALAAPDGPIRRFADDPIRAVLRPTRQYALVLGESYHPDVLRDALDRDRLIDRLWVAVPARPELERVIAWEHADLVDGDVPLFTTRPGSRDLFTAHGSRVDAFFTRSGLDAATEKIRSLSEGELLRQQWVVRASLVALLPGGHDGFSPEAAAPGQSASHPARAREAPSGEECIDAALVVARRLASLAMRRGGHASWLGLTLLRDRDWVIQPIGGDLYGGTLGVAFFLAHFAAVAHDDDSARLARDLIAQVVSRARATLDLADEQSIVVPGSLGAFGALGGTVYTLAHLAALWNDDTLGNVASGVVARAASAITEDRHLDVIGGVAGLMMAAAALHRVRPGAASCDVLRAGADRLLATAERTPAGLAWSTTLASRQPLTGFSHGASGMALALATAGELLADGTLIAAALEALRYERSTFDARRMNWPDYRVLDEEEAPDEPPVMWSWCHGAPGIGLGRLGLLGLTPDPAVVDDLRIALESTMTNGFGSNDSLCHGDLGNLELFVRARELGHGGPWERTLASESARVVERVAKGESRCGIPGGVETPGLMMGLAGIGYGILRVGAPDRVPSLLSLEPPRRRRAGVAP